MEANEPPRPAPSERRSSYGPRAVSSPDFGRGRNEPLCAGCTFREVRRRLRGMVVHVCHDYGPVLSGKPRTLRRVFRDFRVARAQCVFPRKGNRSGTGNAENRAGLR